MRFTLQTLLLSCVLIWSSLAAFGLWGIGVAAILLVVAACVRSTVSKPTKAWILVLIAIVAALLLLPELVVVERPCSRIAACRNNLKNVALALRNYASDYGTLPPAYVSDADGKPMYSWRVLILPFVDRRDLFEQYDFNQPWNSPKNQRLAQTLRFYQCPSDPGAESSDMTSYVAVVGAATAWPGNTGRAVEDFPEPDRTILLVEVANSGIHWTQPRDVTIADLAGFVRQPGPDGQSGIHVLPGGYFHHDDRGIQVAMADGSVRFLPANLPAATLEDLLTVDKQRPVDLQALHDLRSLNRQRLHWPHIVALATLAASFLFLLLRPRRPEPQADA